MYINKNSNYIQEFFNTTNPREVSCITREIYNKWLEEAKNDFEAALVLHEAKIFNSAVFHLQQSVEKTLKSILYFYDAQPWGHSLIELIKHLQKIGQSQYTQFLNAARRFDRHYIASRYPDALPGGSPSEAYDVDISDELRQVAREIIEFAEEDILKGVD